MKKTKAKRGREKMCVVLLVYLGWFKETLLIRHHLGRERREGAPYTSEKITGARVTSLRQGRAGVFEEQLGSPSGQIRVSKTGREEEQRSRRSLITRGLCRLGRTLRVLVRWEASGECSEE